MATYEVCMNSSHRARSIGITCGPVRAVFLSKMWPEGARVRI